MKKSFTSHWIICLLLLTAAPTCARYQEIITEVKAESNQKIQGLRAPVIVRRDEHGVPYIEASNEDDLMFAQGYITASDRLWQMDLLRRTARGELSEIFGNRTLPGDRGRRFFGFARLSEEAAAGKISKPFLTILESYARGVNAYIAGCNDESLPPEFKILKYKPREWRAADSLVIGKLFAETLSTTWFQDIMRANLSDVPAEKRHLLLLETSPLDVLLVGNDQVTPKNIEESSQPAKKRDGKAKASMQFLEEFDLGMRETLKLVGMYAENAAASNAWVVSGKRSATGKPILANDPHLTASAPSLWHLAHLSSPETRVAGVTIPGVPGIVVGHNNWIAWGINNINADVQDLYIESFDPSSPNMYKTWEGLKPAEVGHELIKVRKSMTDPATETIDMEIRTTMHGPVIPQDNKFYAVRWPILDPANIEIEGFYHLNHARNWSEFCSALSQYQGPPQNFVYADVRGHIGYYAAGKIPIRESGQGDQPYDGTAGKGEWIGFIPFNKLPFVLDPPSGIIVSANNRMVGQNYPYVITKDWYTPHRARRILDLLTSKQKNTIEDMREIQGDIYSLSAVTFVKGILKSTQDTAQFAGDKSWQETLQLFSSWDGKVMSDSRVPSLIWAMRTAYRDRILKYIIGENRARNYHWGNNDTLLDQLITEQPAEWLPQEFKSYRELFYACHQDARGVLSKQLGADEKEWKWGKIGVAQFPHPLASAPLVGNQFKIPAFGENGSGGRVGTSPNVGAAVSMRFIADLSDWDKTTQGIALGVSGNPSSPHWKDQLEGWRAVNTRKFPFSAGAINHVAKTTITLSP